MMNTRAILFSLILAAMAIAPAELFAATYYVATTGNDNNNGSQGSPWRTITKAAQSMVAGDTTNVRAGTYTEASCIQTTTNGSAGNPITFQAYAGESPILDEGLNATGFCVTGRSYITVSGFEIRNVWSGVDANGSNHIVVSHNYIHHVVYEKGNNTAGVSYDSCATCQVDNSEITDVYETISGSGHYNGVGILYYDATNTIIEHNYIHDIDLGIMPKRAPSAVENLIVRYNLITGARACIWQSVGGDGDPPHRTVFIYNNICYGSQTFYWINGTKTGTDDNIQIYSNTTDTLTSSGAEFDSATTNVKVYDNIFYISSHPAEWMQTGGSTIALSDYNDFYPTWQIIYQGTTYSTLAAWQANGFDAHSFNSDPLFVNRSAHDYHLQAGSPAKNAGRVGGTSGGAVFDMGAYSTGTEVIGPISSGNPPAAPTGLSVQ